MDDGVCTWCAVLACWEAAWAACFFHQPTEPMEPVSFAGTGLERRRKEVSGKRRKKWTMLLAWDEMVASSGLGRLKRRESTRKGCKEHNGELRSWLSLPGA
jgi:hypothetical protein